jgi:uncharacterized membrane protein
MKTITEFVKSTLVGGFFVILPMLIIYLLLKETIGVVTVLASPIMDLLPESFVASDTTPLLTALVLLIMTAFLMGVILRYSFAKKAVDAFEGKLLNKLPGYTIIRSLTRRFSGSEDTEVFRPALMAMPMESYAVVFIIEEMQSDHYSVLVPMSPTPGAGNVLIVPRDRITLLDASTAAVFDAMSRWGEGLKASLPAEVLRY